MFFRNKKREDQIFIGLGENLGFFKHKERMVYGIKLGKETMEISEQAYQVWKVANWKPYAKFEYPKATLLGEAECDEALEELKNKGLLIEWEREDMEERLSGNVLIPKGNFMEFNGEETQIREFAKSRTVTLDFMSSAIWQYAHTDMNIKQIYDEMRPKESNEEKEFTYLFYKWIRMLIYSGLIAIDKK